MLAALDRCCPGRGESLAYQLLDLKRADALAKASHCTGYAVELDAVTIALRLEVFRGATFRVSDLAVRGGDVIRECGIAPGPAVGEALRDLLRRVVDAELPNDRDMGLFLTQTGVIDPTNLTTGQSTILGVVTLDTGVIGGLISGALVAYLHNRFYKIELPAVFSIFNGTRFIPAATLVSCSALGLVMSFVFPPIQGALSLISAFIGSTGALGSFVYGTCERLLLPFGLHHFIYLPFFFTSLGGTMPWMYCCWIQSSLAGSNVAGFLDTWSSENCEARTSRGTIVVSPSSDQPSSAR